MNFFKTNSYISADSPQSTSIADPSPRTPITGGFPQSYSTTALQQLIGK